MYNSIEKICSFYASELHLTTILMQYIYEKTKEGRKILNVLERDLIKEAEKIATQVLINKRSRESAERAKVSAKKKLVNK